MPELIDRQAALEIAMSYCPDDDGSCSKAGHDIREMLDEIEALPTIETEVLMIKSDAIRSLTDEETAIFKFSIIPKAASQRCTPPRPSTR